MTRQPIGDKYETTLGISFSFIETKVMIPFSAFDSAHFLFFPIDFACWRLLNGTLQGRDFTTSNTRT